MKEAEALGWSQGERQEEAQRGGDGGVVYGKMIKSLQTGESH